MEAAGSRAGGTQRFVVTDAERQVADLLPIEVAPELARATVQAVPFWFHTFALNRAAGIYTPGAARDHRYRVALLPADFAGHVVSEVLEFLGKARCRLFFLVRKLGVLVKVNVKLLQRREFGVDLRLDLIRPVFDVG